MSERNVPKKKKPLICRIPTKVSLAISYKEKYGRNVQRERTDIGVLKYYARYFQVQDGYEKVDFYDIPLGYALMVKVPGRIHAFRNV